MEMKMNLLILIFLIAGCTTNERGSTANEPGIDSIRVQNSDAEKNLPLQDSQDIVTKAHMPSRVYNNDRFRNVKVKQVKNGKYIVSGEAQVFEATFSWLLKDGDKEVLNGHTMTNAGAPAWGSFSFTIDATKNKPDSTLDLVIYEASAKDGSMQHELHVRL